ncbi:WD40-repeat-containing domain protein [Pilobolus umbonatus]|nr:WD40-repeat-containing domain protein [Pilobolus umbonatus]
MWKKNSPFLYDLVITHALEWPSLTCQWFPDIVDSPDNHYKIQRLLLGTHTNEDEPNYVQIASVKLPKEQLAEDMDIDEKSGKKTDTFINITQKILHEGEVNRARYQLENNNIIATKSKSGEVYIFDCTAYDPFPKENDVFSPTLRLTGHDKEGYGLAWNPHKSYSSHLLSAAFDSKICHWDIKGTNKDSKRLEPLRVYTGHSTGVEDIAWHTKIDTVFASVGDDARLMIWDTRNTASDKAVHNIHAHGAEVNCVAFAPNSEWILATGSGDKTAALWDLRNLKSPLHSLRAHQSEILQLAWSPHHDGVLATASSDRRILVWDLSKIDAPQLPEEIEDGPPELLFMHGGHTNKISDFGWNPSDPWVLASTADDNIVQVWQMASNIYNPNEVDEDIGSTSVKDTNDLNADQSLIYQDSKNNSSNSAHGGHHGDNHRKEVGVNETPSNEPLDNTSPTIPSNSNDISPEDDTNQDLMEE